MGVKEPSFLESYGESFFAKGNPDLDPERSTTFDVGVEQRLFGNRLRASVTAFHHDYRDQIAYTVVDCDDVRGHLREPRADPGPGDRGGARGAAGAARCTSSASTRTWTARSSRARAASTPCTPPAQPLLRRPRHQGSFSAQLSFPRWSAGATLVRVGERADSDFVGLGLDARRPRYTRLDARARACASPARSRRSSSPRTCSTREYQEVLGYPALGRSVRGGLRLSVGGRP